MTRTVIYLERPTILYIYECIQHPSTNTFFSCCIFQECQNLIEENRRLINLSGGVPTITAANGNGLSTNHNNNSNNSSNVEAVILQTQVDTLQWQLKQVRLFFD